MTDNRAGNAVKDFTLKKHLILKDKKHISSLFREGKRFYSGAVRVILKPVIEESNFKVAFLVNRRLGRKAVIRNRIKRYLRELFRHNKCKFPIGNYIVFDVTKPYDKLNYHILKNDFERLLNSEEFIDFCNKGISEVSVTAEK